MIAANTQRVGIIDLGSNTARLIVMGSAPGYAYRLEEEIREVVRLRQGMTDAGLHQASVARALSTLHLFKRFCDSFEVDLIIPTATSAVREARNGPSFVAQVEQEVGLSLRVLAGEEEAYYAALGALNEIPVNDGFVVDIGGGSAQISQVRDRRFVCGASLPLGALALTERFIHHDPATKSELAALGGFIDQQLDTVSWLTMAEMPPGGRLVGLGGTIRNLGKLDAARTEYPLNTLHGFQLSQASVHESLALLKKLRLPRREKLAGLSSDRADIITPGAMVIHGIMRRLGQDELLISVNGLREGLFLEHFWEHLSYPVVDDVRRFSVLNMARVYQYQKKHANHVRYLSGRLFDQLRPLHGYGQAERDLLDAAALLHDLGSIISYQDHHKHSETLIINSGLPGFTPREVALIALQTRFHRQGTPRTRGYASVLRGEKDGRLLTHLAAILRLAEFLERGRSAVVDDVTAAWDDETLRLTLIAEYYPAVELWDAERNAAALVAQAFHRQVRLESTAAPDTPTTPDL